MAAIDAQNAIEKMMRDFDQIAAKYERNEIDRQAIYGVSGPLRLDMLVFPGFGRYDGPVGDRVSPEELSESNLSIFRRAMNRLIGKLLDPSVDPAREIDGLVGTIIDPASDYIPDAELERLEEFLHLYKEKLYLDEMPDKVERSRLIEELRGEVRKAASEFLKGPSKDTEGS